MRQRGYATGDEWGRRAVCEGGGKYLKELEIGSNSANSYRQLTQRYHQKAWSCAFREKKGKRRVGGGKGGKERRGGKRGGKRGGRGEGRGREGKGGEGRGREGKGGEGRGREGKGGEGRGREGKGGEGRGREGKGGEGRGREGKGGEGRGREGKGGEGRGRKEKGQMEAELREGWRLTTCCSVGLRWNSQRKGSPERFPLSVRVTPPSGVREEEREEEGGGEWR